LPGHYAGDICRQQGQVCLQKCLLWRKGWSDPGVTEIVNISACFDDVQFRWGHGASSNCRLPHVPQAICWHSAPWHRGSVLLHPSCGACIWHLCIEPHCGLFPPGQLRPPFSSCYCACDGGFISFMGIMHHGQIVGMASLGTEPCVRACPARVFCWSGKPGHGGDLRTIGCDAGRWLAQPLGAQSPFTSPRSLTVQTMFARGCG
jgi:hypothetical protein